MLENLIQAAGGTPTQKMNTKNQIVPGAAQNSTQAAQGLDALMGLGKQMQGMGQQMQPGPIQVNHQKLGQDRSKRVSPLMSPEMRSAIYGNS